MDYVATIGEDLTFMRGDEVVCHRVPIVDDNICEVDPAENFFSSLSFVSGILPIDIDPEMAEVIINDVNETECGKLFKHQLMKFFHSCIQ